MYKLKTIAFWLQILILSFLPVSAQLDPVDANSPSDTNAQLENAIIVGYSLIAQPNGIVIQGVLEDGSVTQAMTTLSNFTIEEQYATQWNIYERSSITLSHDRKTLAFTATQDDINADLFLLDLVSGTNEQHQLSFPVGSTTRLIWSPHDTKLFIDLRASGQAFALLYDVGSQQTLYTFDELAFSPTWLRDSNQFVYNGNSNCTTICNSMADLYLVNIAANTNTALTTIDTDELGITDQLIKPPVVINDVVYEPSSEKIYFILAEVYDAGAPREVEMLASVDLDGNVAIEADLASLYPSSISILPLGMFYRPDDNAIYIISDVNDFLDGRYALRWSIIRYDLAGWLEIAYETVFTDILNSEIITDLAVSPDQNLIALGGTDHRDETGSVTVVQLSNGQEILKSATKDSVCNIYWSDDGHIVYGQSNSVTCTHLRQNRPFNRLIEHNISNNTTTTILDGQGDKTYFISIYPQTPTNYPPFEQVDSDTE